LQRALAIGEKILGPEHPDLATRLNNLAEFYRAQGRSAEAEPLYQRALAIGEKTLGPEHPDLAIQLNNLALLYQATGRYAKAEPLLQRALAIFEKTLGSEHPNVAPSLNNLAEFYRAQGRSAEAEPLFQRALAIVKVSLGEGHPHTQTVQRNLNSLVGLGQTLQTMVVRVLPKSQAAQIGLQPGDVIESYGGERIVQSASLVAAVRRLGESPRELIIVREGQTFQFQVAPGPLGVELRETAAPAEAAAEAPRGPSATEPR
jgi:tetratricopeptide (TPR) repeat protein